MFENCIQLNKKGLVLSINIISNHIVFTSENKKGYYFKITKIEPNSRGVLSFHYSDGKEHSFANFYLTTKNDIAVDDSIAKPPNSDTLYVFRKDWNAQYKLHFTQSIRK